MRGFVAVLGLLAVGCGGGNLAGPSEGMAPAQRAIVVNVVADQAADTAAFRSALDVVQAHFGGRLRFVRDGSGDRTLRVTIDAARMAEPSAHHGYRVQAFAVPWTCTCTAEGEIVLRSAEVATLRKTLLHEIGHLFGLGHHGDRGMMGWSEREDEIYSEAEWARMDAALAADQDTAGGNYFTW